MNDENLIPINQRTKSEARAISSAGGKASGEARRRRKTLKEELLLMLEDEQIQRSVAAALIKEAIDGNASKSVKGAFETIRDTIGEKPVERMETTQTVIDMSKFTTEEIKAMLDDDV